MQETVALTGRACSDTLLSLLHHRWSLPIIPASPIANRSTVHATHSLLLYIHIHIKHTHGFLYCAHNEELDKQTNVGIRLSSQLTPVQRRYLLQLRAYFTAQAYTIHLLAMTCTGGDVRYGLIQAPGTQDKCVPHTNEHSL